MFQRELLVGLLARMLDAMNGRQRRDQATVEWVGRSDAV